jgi:hypothetical protein
VITLPGESGGEAHGSVAILYHKFAEIVIQKAVSLKWIAIQIKNDRRIFNTGRLDDVKVDGIGGTPLHAGDFMSVDAVNGVGIPDQHVERL